MNRINGFDEKEATELTRQIARERIAPGAGEKDKNSIFPREVMQALGENSILGIMRPQILSTRQTGTTE